jgi:ribosome-associated toxin RatA of RatAB toxin-antitoxin module
MAAPKQCGPAREQGSERTRGRKAGFQAHGSAARAHAGQRAVPAFTSYRIGQMALVEKSVLVQFTPQQMFRLVDQVEDYPAFLPWCGGSSVADRGAAKLLATVMIDYHRVRQSFTTENTRVEPESIDVKLVDGPFRQLDGSWRFKALGQEACKIEFRLHYEFASRILEKLLSPVFNHIANTFVDAFVKRAEQVYGKQ